MATNYFIPKIWSETLYQALEKELVAVRNCNREFEGEIKNVGDTVTICGLGDVNVFDYAKNSNMMGPQVLSTSQTNLKINQCKAFHFQIDDIDAAQQSPVVMKHAMHRAAVALADAADRYIYNLCIGIPANRVMNREVNTKTVLDFLIDVRTKLMQDNVGASEEIVLEVTPEIAALLMKAKLDIAPADTLEKGYIGKILGFRVYVSNNVLKDTGGDTTYHRCFARTRRAIAFAEQLQEMEAYRPENRFADAIKGMMLFGAKIVYEKEFVLLDMAIAPEEDEAATA